MEIKHRKLQGELTRAIRTQTEDETGKGETLKSKLFSSDTIKFLTHLSELYWEKY
jgi:hypothetical protein